MIPRLPLMMALLLASCVSTPKTPTNAPVHDALPTRFEVMEYGQHNGTRTVTSFHEGYLVVRWYGSGASKSKLVGTEYYAPSKEKWAEFWKAVSDLKLWSWQSSYNSMTHGVSIDDGASWSIAITYKGHKIESAGENAGPQLGHPSKVELDPQPKSIVMLKEAIAELIKP